jgi:hypothetical protein
MAKTDKADKLVGGNKVSPVKVEWSVKIDTADGQLIITGYADDATAAALAAHGARQSYLDAINAQKQADTAHKTAESAPSTRAVAQR